VDVLHLACAEKSGDFMLTIDGDIVKKTENTQVKVKVESPLIPLKNATGGWIRA